ncbi:MAG: tetratricopeptide repeat protein [Bacteroidia bacterium]|nr:tetratricopeptide repeat protein [Bacteroidia bacterium]
MLTAIFEVNYYLGKYAKAIEYCEKEIEIRKTLKVEKHPSYATSLNNLAQLYKTIGNYSTAEPLYLAEMNICKEVLGEKHPDYILKQSRCIIPGNKQLSCSRAFVS